MQRMISYFQNEIFSTTKTGGCEDLTESLSSSEHQLQRADIVVSLESQLQPHEASSLKRLLLGPEITRLSSEARVTFTVESVVRSDALSVDAATVDGRQLIGTTLLIRRSASNLKEEHH